MKCNSVIGVKGMPWNLSYGVGWQGRKYAGTTVQVQDTQGRG